MMNKKIAASAVIIVIVVASIADWFANNKISELQSQNNDLQKQVNELQDQNRELEDENDELQKQLDLLQKRVDFSPEVQITDFSSGAGWLNVVGMTIAIGLDVTIQNTGISDVDGLTLEIKRLNVDEDPYNITRRLDILQAGGTTEIWEDFVVGWNTYFSAFHDRSLVATLKLGDVVLDEQHFLPKQYLYVH